MMKKRSRLSLAHCTVRLNRPFYFIGDTINGHLNLHLEEGFQYNIIMIKFTGWEYAKWVDVKEMSMSDRDKLQPHQIKDYKQEYLQVDNQDSDEEDHFQKPKQQIYVKDDKKNTVNIVTKHCSYRQITNLQAVLHQFVQKRIPSGQYNIPFSFKTSEAFPASFKNEQSGNQRKGQIRYEISIFVRDLRSYYGRQLTLKTQQVVLCQRQISRSQSKSRSAHIKTCCVIDQGTIKLQSKIDKNVCTPGEFINVHYLVDATQIKIKVPCVYIKLYNKITFISKQQVQYTQTNLVFREWCLGVEKGGKRLGHQVLKIQNRYSKFDSLNIAPSSHGQKIRSIYELEVEAELACFESCCGHLPIIRHQIFIAPLYNESQFKTQEKLFINHFQQLMNNITQYPIQQNPKLSNMTNPYY